MRVLCVMGGRCMLMLLLLNWLRRDNNGARRVLHGLRVEGGAAVLVLVLLLHAQVQRRVAVLLLRDRVRDDGRVEVRQRGDEAAPRRAR